ncbi:MAG: glycosyltransferase family 9 protein [Gammaproteobacteria bacterium]|nr:glycosyltransferase family 9 protein [Gammaproteobacteria bacterium]
MAHSILLITLSNIGDAVMTTPVLEVLHRRYPEALIDLVADRRSSEVFTHCPYRGRIVFKEKRAGWRGTLQLVRALRRTRYDLIVDLRTDGLAYLLRARRRLTKRHRQAHGPHAVEQHMGVIAALGDTEIPPTHIWLTQQLEHAAAQHLQTLPGTRWLALGPGANWEPKIWPAASFRDLIAQLADTFDGIILLGGPGDAERCARVAQDCPLPCVNLAGQTGLLDAAAVLARATVFVGNDSGLGHLASAVGTPTLTLFGPGQPERYRPWGEHARWLTSVENDLQHLSAADVAADVRRTS